MTEIDINTKYKRQAPWLHKISKIKILTHKQSKIFKSDLNKETYPQSTVWWKHQCVPLRTCNLPASEDTCALSRENLCSPWDVELSSYEPFRRSALAVPCFPRGGQLLSLSYFRAVVHNQGQLRSQTMWEVFLVFTMGVGARRGFLAWSRQRPRMLNPPSAQDYPP